MTLPTVVGAPLVVTPNTVYRLQSLFTFAAGSGGPLTSFYVRDRVNTGGFLFHQNADGSLALYQNNTSTLGPLQYSDLGNWYFYTGPSNLVDLIGLQVVDQSGQISTTVESALIGNSLSRGFDFPFTIHSLSDVQAVSQAGYNFVVRYYTDSGTAWNALTATEASTLKQGGLNIVSVWETTKNNVKNPIVDGTTDAQHAITEAKAAGQPGGSPIYFAVDRNIPDGVYTMNDVVNYFSQIQAVFNNSSINTPGYKIGVYGSGSVDQTLLSDNLLTDNYGAGYTWVPGASPDWSGNSSFTSWSMNQYAVSPGGNAGSFNANSKVLLQGVPLNVQTDFGGVDLDVGQAAGFGAWSPGTNGDDTVTEQVPASLSATAGVTTAVNGIQVLDDGLNGEMFSVSVSDGTAILSASGASGSGTNSLSINGTISQVNSSLQTLTYRNSKPGSDFGLAVSVTDLADHSSSTSNVWVQVSASRNDFNADGSSDMVLQNTDGATQMWLLNGTSTTSTKSLGNPGSSWHVAATGDFNHDGKADILWQNTDGQAGIWLMNGSAFIGNPGLGNPGSAWHIIATGDFNADGNTDILWQNTDGLAGIWELNGTSFASNALLGNFGPSWHTIGTGDFNNDGKADILWQNTDGVTGIWEMNGTSLLASGPIANPGAAWHAIGTGDFNGDGTSDILWQNTDGLAGIWEMNGLSLLGSGPLGNFGSSWHVIGTSDFNGDGKADVIWQNTDGLPGIWEMNGLSRIASGPLPNLGAAWQVKDDGPISADQAGALTSAGRSSPASPGGLHLSTPDSAALATEPRLPTGWVTGCGS